MVMARSSCGILLCLKTSILLVQFVLYRAALSYAMSGLHSSNLNHSSRYARDGMNLRVSLILGSWLMRLGRGRRIDAFRCLSLFVLEVLHGVAHLLHPAGHLACQNRLAAGHQLLERCGVLLGGASCAPFAFQGSQFGCGLVVGDDGVVDLQ